MTRIGKAELVPGELMSIDASLARIDAVTVEEVHAVAQDIVGVAPTLAVIGPDRALKRVS
jgi:predicted Zn-dependent peptidase